MTDLGDSCLICVNPDEGLPKQNCYFMKFDHAAQRLVCSLKAHFCCRETRPCVYSRELCRPQAVPESAFSMTLMCFQLRLVTVRPLLPSAAASLSWLCSRPAISPRALFMNCQQVGHLNKQSSLLLTHRGRSEQLTAPAMATCDCHANWLQGTAVTARDAHISPQPNALSLTVTRTCCTAAIGNM